MLRHTLSVAVAVVAGIASSAIAQDNVVIQREGPRGTVTVTAPAPGGAPAAQVAAPTHGRVTRARDIVGLDVVSATGENYGMIDDLVINPRSGQIEYIMVTESKEGKDLRPIPWQAITLFRGEGEDEQYVILGVERERFLKSPTIVRTELPTMTYQQWNEYTPQVTTYYKSTTPAEARAVRRAARAIRRAAD